MKFTHLFLALLLIGMPFVVFAQEEAEAEKTEQQQQEQQEQEQEQQQEEEVADVTEDEISSNTASTTNDPNAYAHLDVRRSFVNKTFFATIPTFVRVQIYNLGTA